MFDFHFVFINGREYDVKNVIKVKMSAGKDDFKEFAVDKAPNFSFSLGSMYLCTADNKEVTVSSENLLLVEIAKQNA